jgi:hypothetical protein
MKHCHSSVLHKPSVNDHSKIIDFILHASTNRYDSKWQDTPIRLYVENKTITTKTFQQISGPLSPQITGSSQIKIHKHLCTQSTFSFHYYRLIGNTCPFVYIRPSAPFSSIYLET